MPKQSVCTFPAVSFILLLLAALAACQDPSREPSVALPVDEDLAGWPALESLGSYPRPDLVRQRTTLLTGQWAFAFDPADVGLKQQWFTAPDFPGTIEVPFCVESEASGVGDPDPPAVVWYCRSFTHQSGDAGQTLLIFGAVDYHAMVWLNGTFLGEHFGGYTPFVFEVGSLLKEHNTLVVRVEDRLSDVRPRGKQSWLGRPYQVFYETVTGIWQPVWLEEAGPVYVQRYSAAPDLEAGEVGLRVQLGGALGPVTLKAVALSPDGERTAATASFEKTEAIQTVELRLPFSELRAWSPEQPNLYSLRLVAKTDAGRDVVDTYFGARTIEAAGGDVRLNGEYLYQKLVLNQGYYAGGHYTPVDPADYRRDIELIKAYGFNGLRMHEKIESPRLLFWADVLGALVWEEMPTAWRFSAEQNAALEREWREAIERDRNHPSIITWVPFNEAWGLGIVVVPGIFIPAVLLPDRIEFMKHMVEMTRHLDSTRLVVDNSGWDHTEATDIVDIHHYLPTLEQASDLYREVQNLYGYRWSLGQILMHGYNIFAPGEGYRGQPLLVSEYGGFGWYHWEEPGGVLEAYRRATRLIQAQPHIDGYCYTQFNDTYQEKNGLVDMERTPIVPPDEIRAVNDLRSRGPHYGDYLDLPGAETAADPHVIETGGTWYLYPTRDSVSVECWSSTDLEHWEYRGRVWGPAPAGAWNSSGIWAPDVFEHDGRFYLYYTAAGSMIGVAVADSPVGPFVDVYDHPLIGAGNAGALFSIDPHMFRDVDGRLYLYATAYVPVGALRVFPMADPVTVGGPGRVLFAADPLSWEGLVNEGPWMLVHDGVYYLMYSGGSYDRPTYAVGYATSDNPMGPFTKCECNPVLHTDAANGFYGPGHHSVTVGPDGELWMVYHTKVNAEVSVDRRIRKNRLAFTEDGRLYVEVGLGPPPAAGR